MSRDSSRTNSESYRTSQKYRGRIEDAEDGLKILEVTENTEGRIEGTLKGRESHREGTWVHRTSVADPDPDPVGFGLFGSPGSGSGKIPDPDPLSTKRPLEF